MNTQACLRCLWCGERLLAHNLACCAEKHLPGPDYQAHPSGWGTVALCPDCAEAHGKIQWPSYQEDDDLIASFGGPLAARLRRTCP